MRNSRVWAATILVGITIIYAAGAAAQSRNRVTAGRISGSSELTLELTDIVSDGTAHPLLTSTFEVKGKGEGKKTAGKVLGGTGLGAIIGGIAGEEQGQPLARSLVQRAEQRLPVPKRASSCRSLANPCLSFDLSSPCLCRSQKE